MRFLGAIPLVFSIVSFVLALLALLAGKSPNFMEDYNIVMFNTSTLGHNLIPTPTTGNNGQPTTTSGGGGGGGIGGFLTSAFASATAAVASEAAAVESEAASIANKVGNDIADKLASQLGIHQFYSLHAMDICEGNFQPNATAPGATANATNCTAPLTFGNFNISQIIDDELHLGGLVDFTLQTLGFNDDLQSAIDMLPKLFEVLAVMYILAVAFMGMSILGSLAALVMLPHSGRWLVLLDFLFAALGMIFLLVGNLVTTIGGNKAVDEVNQHGNEIGIYANKGTKFLAVTWAAFALAALTLIYWVWEFFAVKRARDDVPGGRRGWRGGSMRQTEKEPNAYGTPRSGFGGFRGNRSSRY